MSEALSSNIKINLNTLKQAEKRLSKEKKEELSKLLEEIESIQKRINEIMLNFGLQEKCTICKESCCVARMPESHIDIADLYVVLFEISIVEKEKILTTIEEFDPKQEYCCFLDPQIGCIISDVRRPLVCKTFFCTTDLVDITSVLVSKLRAIYIDILLILEGR